MKLLKILSAVCTSLIFVGGFTPAQATSTDIVLNLEGNPTCSSLGDNSAVLERRDSNPGGIRTLTLPLSQGGTQTITYEVVEPNGANAQVVQWDITEVNGFTNETVEFATNVNAINYIILKAQGSNKGARVFHFGTSENVPGAIGDTDEEAPGGRMAAVSFCYGLTTGFNAPEPPIEIADLPACEELTGSELFTTGITCPLAGPGGIGDPEEQLIINMALNKSQFGFNFTNENIRACTCNTELKPCNPDLDSQRVDAEGKYVDAATGTIFVDQNEMPISPNFITADNLSQAERTCLEYSDVGNGIPTGVNENVPFVIQGVENPDSYICYTIGGTRYCYGHY